MDSSSDHRPPAHLDALTGVRFFFALLVVLLHVKNATDWLDAVPGLRDGIINAGWAGVNFFFILSGFILTYVYFPMIGKIAPWCFYRARFARIYPVYILGLICAVGIVLLQDFSVLLRLDVASLFLHGLLLQAWFVESALHWNPPGWSLSAEAFFYLLFPLIAKLIVRLEGWRLAGFATLFYLLSLAIPVFGYGFGRADLYYPDRTPLFIFLPLIRMPEFLLGVCAACFFMRHSDFCVAHARALFWGGLIGIIAGLQLLALFVPVLTINNGLLGPCAVALICALAAAPKGSTGGAARLFSLRPVVALGQASYALYILHLPILLLVAGVLPDNTEGMVALALYLGITIAAALLVFRFYETPLRGMIRGVAPVGLAIRGQSWEDSHHERSGRDIST